MTSEIYQREPVEWQESSLLHDSLLYLTASELTALKQELLALAAGYQARTLEPSLRPADSKPVAFFAAGFPSPALRMETRRIGRTELRDAPTRVVELLERAVDGGRRRPGVAGVAVIEGRQVAWAAPARDNPAVTVDPRSAGRFRHSGGGYAIVQRLIEQVTGEPFAEAVRRVVLDPLGMLTGSTEDGTGAVVMSSGCRSPLAVRLLLEIGDAQGWTDLRAFQRGIGRRISDLLLRVSSQPVARGRSEAVG